MAISKPRTAKSHQHGDQATAAVHRRCARSMRKPAASPRSRRRCRSDLGPAFRRAAELILKAKGRLIITGLGKSGHIGRKIAATFASTGTPAFFVHAAEASHGDLGMITADDVIMALSWSGEQPEMKNLITYAKRFRIGAGRDDRRKRPRRWRRPPTWR